MELFAGRNIIIATKHQKEKVIAPLLEEALGLRCMVPTDLDTDQLGTFSGEINRPGSPLETLKQKCLLAIEQYPSDLVLASEGSFGPHPFLPFIAADEEYMMLLDRKNNIEIVVKELSSETNFAGKTINNYQELLSFAEEVRFPSHALILKAAEFDNSHLLKGIQSEEELAMAFQKLLPINGSVYAMTDMRAMYNPSRMSVIEQVVKKLIQKIKSTCPQCNFPGFDVSSIIPGLPCKNCLLPSSSALSHVYQCKQCNYQKELMYPKGQSYIDPMYCDTCNP
ncbi:MAG: DUF6671 family protein [Bacteroidia bacterium]